MSYPFPHKNLDSFELALDLATEANRIATRLPRTYRGLSEQLVRSGPAVALLIAEGMNRQSDAQKRQRFVEARGECGEAVATVDVLVRLDLVSVGEAQRFLAVAERVAATLTGLIRRFS